MYLVSPIEETVKAMDEGRQAGKFKYLGISECSAETLRRACKVVKVDAVQVEYSPWTLDIEQNGLLSACRELGVAVVAYSPLGRGFLTGRFKSPDDFEEGDFRKFAPRFSKENFPKNLEVRNLTYGFNPPIVLSLSIASFFSHSWSTGSKSSPRGKAAQQGNSLWLG